MYHSFFPFSDVGSRQVDLREHINSTDQDRTHKQSAEEAETVDHQVGLEQTVKPPETGQECYRF